MFLCCFLLDATTTTTVESRLPLRRDRQDVTGLDPAPGRPPVTAGTRLRVANVQKPPTAATTTVAAREIPQGNGDIWQSLETLKQQALAGQTKAKQELLGVFREFANADAAPDQKAIDKLVQGGVVGLDTTKQQILDVLENLEQQTHKASDQGNTAEAERLSQQYERFNQELTTWIAQCVQDINNSQ